MQTRFKNFSALLLIVFLFSHTLFFTSCNDDKEKQQDIQTTQEDATTVSEKTTEKKIIIDNSLVLKDTSNFDVTTSEVTTKKVEKIYKEVQNTASLAAFRKNKTTTKTNYIKKISALTKLSQEKLEEIKSRKGLREIENIISTLPEGKTKKEAERITHLMRLGRLSVPVQAKDYLLSKKTDTLTQNEQINAYLDVYVEAATLHSSFETETNINTKQTKKAQDLAALTGLSIEKLAIIENQLGVLGLRSAITNIPNFPQKEEALKSVSN